jgi:hypothetical protein
MESAFLDGAGIAMFLDIVPLEYDISGHFWAAFIKIRLVDGVMAGAAGLVSIYADLPTSSSRSLDFTMTLYLLDYGAGNVASLANSLKKLGHEFTWIKSPEDFAKADVSHPFSNPFSH